MAREKSEKLWIAGGVGACLLVAGGIWMFAVSPALDDADSVRSQSADVATQNLALQSNVSRLKEQYAQIGKARRALKYAQAALPDNLAMSEFTDELNAEANKHHLKVTSLNATAPVAFASAAPTTTTSTSAPAPAPTTPTTTAASGLYSIPITVVVTGSQPNELAFLHAVQRTGSRAALVTSTQLSTDTASKTNATTMSVNLQVFVAAVAPPVAAPVPGTTPTPSATPGS